MQTCRAMSQGELFLVLATHLILTGLPGIAATLLAARRGLRSVPILLAVGLAATGVIAMLAFWGYYVDRQIGEAFSYFVLLGSVLAIAWVMFDRRPDSGLLRQLAVPLGLWVLGSVFLIYLGFAHGGIDEPILTSATRFTAGTLPSDSGIPFFYSEWFFANGHHGTPPIFPGEWSVSDRPPLQIGYVLAQRPLYWSDTELHYQVLGVVLQQLWIVGLWALLLAARLGRQTRTLVLIAALLSGLALVNGFFVWPKLLPAAMLLAAAALVMTPLWEQLRRSLWGAALVAALLGVAMMGHGSSVFAIIPLAVLAAWRGLPSWRWVGVGLLIGVALMGPWAAFQKYDSPPGNRLNKWMLAGVAEIDDRGTLEAIVDGYGDAGFGGAIYNKGENFVTMAGGGPAVEMAGDAASALFDGELSLAGRYVRNVLFFFLLPSLALLLAGPVAMAVAYRRRRERLHEWTFAVTCLAVAAAGAVLWGLLLFGTLPARTVVHAGTYLVPILALVGCVVGLRATFPRAAGWIVGANSLLILMIYIPALEPRPGSSYSVSAFLLAGLSLAALGLVAWASPDSGEQPRDTVPLDP